SDQSEVWGDIALKMSSMDVSSRTEAIADAYAHFAVPVDEYVGAFTLRETQVGACFVINGAVKGIELFDAADTCARLMPKLIRSYALDAIEERGQEIHGPHRPVQHFLDAVRAAPVDSFTALGEGEDLRLRCATIAGGALAARDRVVHLCAFRQAPPGGAM
ncbi:MAG: hypothetical protein KDI09_03250, partial [Halioglobus sp.]|nr:hypothetical protein [Halioglobus sp.]